MQLLWQIIGTLIVLAALADIYLTILHPRAESSLLSLWIARGVWHTLKIAAPEQNKRRDRYLSYSGPTIILTILATWVLLLLIGFALIIWPALGTAVQASRGGTPTDFAAAIYYSGFSLATLGTGDLAPQTATYRLLTVLESILGFSVFTLVLSYVLSIYSNLTSRNTFALSLHHRTANTADSRELLARLAADNSINTLHQDISAMAQNLINLLESKNSYPVLLYFRYRQTYYALPRITYLAIDTATLIKTALDPEKYRSITNSSGTTELWFGGLHLLEELCQTLIPKIRIPPQETNEPQWRQHYYQALERLEAEGIKTVSDPEAGANSYIAMRHQWSPYLAKLVKYMDYDPNHIFPIER
jgi:hypothetical protein